MLTFVIAAVPASQNDPALPTVAILPTLTAETAANPTLPPTAQSAPAQQNVSAPAAQTRHQIPEFEPYLPTMEPAELPADSEPVPNQVIIRFDPSASQAAREAYLQALGGTVSQQIDALNTVVVAVPNAVESLPPSSALAASEPDYFVHALIDVPTSDPHYAEQWALPVVAAPDAWQALPENAPMVTVAVIDSGICADHPDLQGGFCPVTILSMMTTRRRTTSGMAAPSLA